jgi:hypothetical protein
MRDRLYESSCLKFTDMFRLELYLHTIVNGLQGAEVRFVLWDVAIDFGLRSYIKKYKSSIIYRYYFPFTYVGSHTRQPLHRNRFWSIVRPHMIFKEFLFCPLELSGNYQHRHLVAKKGKLNEEMACEFCLRRMSFTHVELFNLLQNLTT